MIRNKLGVCRVCFIYRLQILSARIHFKTRKVVHLPTPHPTTKNANVKNPQNRYSVYVYVGVLYEQNESIHKLGILTDPDT